MAEVNPMPHAPDIEKQPFIILTKATQEFGQMLKSRFAAMAVDQGDFRVVTLYARPTMGLTADSSFAEVLAMYRRDEIVNQKPIKATVYIGGISTGFTQWNQQAENSDGRVGLKGYSPAHVSTLSEKTLRKIATKMIPDKMPNKQAPSYLFDAGSDLVFSLEMSEKTHNSSLSADAVCLQTALEKLEGAHTKPDVVCWSDGGFKLTQLLLQAHLTITDDLRWAKEHGYDTTQDIDHLLLQLSVARQNDQSLNQSYTTKRQALWRPSFATGRQAIDFVRSLADTRIVIASAPLNASELSIPIDAAATNHFFHLVKRIGRQGIVNSVVKSFGQHEDAEIIKLITSQIPSKDMKVFLSRLAEIGRGPSEKEVFDRMNTIEGSLQQSTAMLQSALGQATVAVFMDRSGKIVDASNGGVARVLTSLLGEQKVVSLQTSHMALTDKQGSTVVFSEEHGAIKYTKYLEAMFALIEAKRLGIIVHSDNTRVETNAPIMPVQVSKAKIENGMRIYKRMGIDIHRLDDIILSKTLPDNPILASSVQNLREFFRSYDQDQFFVAKDKKQGMAHRFADVLTVLMGQYNFTLMNRRPSSRYRVSTDK